MTATATNTNGWAPISSPVSPIPNGWTSPLAASQRVGRGQFASFNASGNVVLNDGATPNLVSAGVGYPSPLSDTHTTAAVAAAMLSWSFGSHAPASTTSNDPFLATDIGAVAWIKDENTIGKLSNSGGSNRSIAGLVFGLDEAGCPVLWTGPIAHLLARAALVVANAPLASHTLSDAAAGTATAERIVRRPRWHGTVTSVTYCGAAVAADNTDYVTITVAKRDGAGGGATTIATYDSRAANEGAATAFVPKAFTLSVVAGAVDLLESDEVLITVAKGGSGKQLTGEVRVNGKVI